MKGMSNAEYESLLVILSGMRGRIVPSDFGMIPNSVEYLLQRLDKTPDRMDRKILYMLLVGEAARSTNVHLHIETLRQRAAEFADDPMALAGLAFGIAALQPTSRAEAVRAAGLAMDVARQKNELVRYSAAQAVRVGILIDEYDLVNRAINVLVDDRNNRREVDTPYEFDFLAEVDSNRCDKVVLCKYEEIRRSVRARGG